MTSSLAMALYGYPRAMRRRTSCSRAVSWSRSGSADGPGLAAKASSTNPARRREKTTSPSATRRMASASPGPDMRLGTYPTAPAAITPTPSSAASATPVADEHRGFALTHLGIDRHARVAGPLGRVDHGLPGRGDQGPDPVVEGEVAHGDHVDRHPVQPLDLLAGPGQGGGERLGV